MTVGTIGLVAMLAASSSVHIFPVSEMPASSLRDICEATDIQSRTACHYYILGVVEQINSDLLPSGTSRLCIARRTSTTTLENAIKSELAKAIDDVRFYGALGAAAFVATAAKLKFSCSGAMQK